jgi:DNA polymerase-4
MRTIFHIDANSAYLSWTAAAMLEKGYPVDIREIPAVISGDPLNRHGIILAKSIPAKKYGIATGQSLFEARQKYPELAVFPPNYDLYMLCSNAMYQILKEYSPLVERYSIDECFLDYTASRNRFGDPVEAAYEIKERIKKELGFTVNVGVSTNKLLAKMGSELKKPDQVHTLWPQEMEKKMWPLPVGELYMVGRATAEKLRRINITTIGDLAKADPNHMKALLKSPGLLLWEFANGIDDSEVTLNSDIIQKGVGNSTTISHDVTDRTEALMILLALTERVAMRLRRLGYMVSLVSVSIKTGGFIHYSHQMKLRNCIDTTTEIYEHVCMLFDQCWKGEPIRKLGVHVSDFRASGARQYSLFDRRDDEKLRALDNRG